MSAPHFTQGAGKARKHTIRVSLTPDWGADPALIKAAVRAAISPEALLEDGIFNESRRAKASNKIATQPRPHGTYGNGGQVDGADAAREGFGVAWESAISAVFGDTRGAELNVESIRIERSYAGASGFVAATAVLLLTASRLQEHEIDEFVAVLFETRGASVAIAGATREGSQRQIGFFSQCCEYLWCCTTSEPPQLQASLTCPNGRPIYVRSQCS